MRTLMVLVLGMCVLACSAPAEEPHTFSITLRAEESDGQALAGVRFWADGRELGVSAVDGALQATLRGRDGDTARIAGLCPPGYLGESEPRALALRAFTAPDGSTRRTLSVRVACARQQRVAALVVRARIGERPLRAPIMVNGERVGDTDDHGTAHVLVHVGPAGTVRVGIDTSAYPKGMPKDPVQVFEAPRPENLLVFDPQIHERAAQLPRRVPRSPRSARVPFRIE